MSKVETTSKQQREIRDLKLRSHHRAPATTIEWNLMYVSEYLKTHRDFLTARAMMMWSCGLGRRWIRIVIIIIVIYLWLSGFHFFPFLLPTSLSFAVFCYEYSINNLLAFVHHHHCRRRCRSLFLCHVVLCLYIFYFIFHYSEEKKV